MFRTLPCAVTSAPHDHFAAGPDCRVSSIAPAGALVVLVAVQLSVPGSYLPPVFKSVEAINIRPRRSFHCRSRLPCDDSGGGRVSSAGGCPTVCAGIVSAAGVQIAADIISAPDDHFAAGPDCRVNESGSGRVGGAGGCPTIGAGIISAAGVEIVPMISPPQTIISLPVQTAV